MLYSGYGWQSNSSSNQLCLSDWTPKLKLSRDAAFSILERCNDVATYLNIHVI
jgi:hypothetical protein